MKTLTPQITEYLINAVIMPAVDYLITDMTIKEAKLRKWQGQIENCYKRQYRLARTIPTSAIRVKELINIASIEDKIEQNRMRSLEEILEDDKILSQSTAIRIMQMQEESWSKKEVINNERFLERKRKTSLIADILYICRKNGFEIEDERWKELMKVEGGKIAIEEIWYEHQYEQHRAAMKKWKVMYVEQMIEEKDGSILKWQFINPGQKRKRRTPQWYKITKIRWSNKKDEMINKMREQNYQIEYMATPRVNLYGDMSRIKWVALKEGDETMVGKKKRKINDEWLEIEHYEEDEITKELSKCRGCKKNRGKRKDVCTKEIKIQQTWSPVVKKVKLEEEDIGEIRVINIKTQLGEGYNIIENINKDSEERNKKAKQKEKMKEQIKKITLITDAAWDKKRKVGCGVWRVEGDNIIKEGMGKKEAESATQMEIEAIIDGINNIEQVKEIEIKTDAETAVRYINGNHKIKRYMQRNDKEGATLRKMGVCLKRNREKKIRAIKITEQTEDESFKEVDKATRELLNSDGGETEGNKTENKGIVWQGGKQNWGWKRIFKIKKRAKNLEQWLKLRRNETERREENKIDWVSTWKYRKKWKENGTTQQQIWRLKVIMRELPTLEKKKERDRKNEDRKEECIKCKDEIETQEHIWECKSREKERGKIKREIYKIIKKEYKEIIAGRVEKEIKEQIKEIIKEEKMGIKWTDIIRGTIPKIWGEWMGKNKFKRVEEVIYTIMELVEKGIRDIWEKRTREVVKWEKEKGIGGKRKKKERTSKEDKKKKGSNKKGKQKIEGKSKIDREEIKRLTAWLEKMKIGIKENLEKMVSE
jgi:hypothetical protein